MRKIILYILLTIWISSAFGQSGESDYKFSIGDKSLIITSGFSLPSFDIGGKLWEKQPGDLSPTVNFGFRYLLPANFGIKLFGEFTTYADDDKGTKNHTRGGGGKYKFSNQIYRGGARLEYHILGNVTDWEARHNVYVFGGGGVAYATSTVVGDPDKDHFVNTTPVTRKIANAHSLGDKDHFVNTTPLPHHYCLQVSGINTVSPEILPLVWI